MVTYRNLVKLATTEDFKIHTTPSIIVLNSDYKTRGDASANGLILWLMSKLLSDERTQIGLVADGCNEGDGLEVPCGGSSLIYLPLFIVARVCICFCSNFPQNTPNVGTRY